MRTNPQTQLGGSVPGGVVSFIKAFESAWGRLDFNEKHWPNPADFLPPREENAGISRKDVGAALFAIDLEFRLKRGGEADVEHYCDLLPELRTDTNAIRELITTEYRCLLFLGQDPDLESYRSRFPEVCDDEFLAELRELRSDPENDPVHPRFRPIVLLPRQGGMGDVFLAYDRELKRRVALKEVRLDLSTLPDVQAGLVHEAELAGKLEHPATVPIYSLGKHDDERPYYAMQFVQGESLEKAIEDLHNDGIANTTRRGFIQRLVDMIPSRASRETRLRVLVRRFVEVCNAIAYAHSKGVLHGDIKPSNILLGPFGETKVVDWGMAVRIDSTGTLPRTSKGGTPHFMSPEQARREPLGETSDVYNLGATLYCILTGKTPHADRGDERLLSPEREAPPLPPRMIARSVPWALQAVCLKAMEARPADRYAHAKALAEDVEHWLADEPISVNREPIGERIQRLGRRYSRELLVVTMLALVLAALVPFLISAAQHYRALNRRIVAADQSLRRRTNTSLDALRNYTQVVSDDEFLKQPAPEMDRLRKKLLGTPMPVFQRLQQELESNEVDDPEARASLAETLLSLATITSQVGRKAEALESYSRAHNLSSSLLRSYPDDSHYQADLAREALGMGTLLAEVCRIDEALRSLREAIDLNTRLVSKHPTELAHHRDLARANAELGVLLRDTGRAIEAKAAFQRSMAILKARVDVNPDDVEIVGDLARVLNNLGKLQAGIGERAEAKSTLLQAAELNESLMKKTPAIVRFRDQRGRTFLFLGLLKAGEQKFDEAERDIEQACTILKSLADEYPAFSQARADLAAAYGSRGNLQLQRKQLGPAEASKTLVRGLLEQLVAENPTVDAYQNDLASFHSNLGVLQFETGRKAEALASFEKAREIRLKLVEGRCVLPLIRRSLAESEFNIGEYQIEIGKPADGLPSFEKAGERLKALVQEFPEDLDSRSMLGRTLDMHALATCKAGRTRDALTMAESAAHYHKECIDKAPEVRIYTQSLQIHEAIMGEIRPKTSDDEKPKN